MFDWKWDRMKGTFLLATLGFCQIVAAKAEDPPQSAAPAPKYTTPAIYICHIGETDKVIAPIALFATAPGEEELKQAAEPLPARKFQKLELSKEQFEQAVAVVSGITKGEPEGPQGREFGTFRITLVIPNDGQSGVEGPKVIVRELPRARMGDFLSALNRLNRSFASPHERLANSLRSLRARLGLGKEDPS